MTADVPAPRWYRLGSPVWGWCAAALFCVVGVPIFLRMPPWGDLTLYQVAANSVGHGGVLYRDVFDTNLPGFVAALGLVRALAGPSAEAARAADLLMAGLALLLLARWAKRGGASAPSVAWLCAGGCGFYLFTSEFNHAQRDVWMMPPALGAALVRVRRLQAGASASRPLLSALLEGLAWGCAVWVKPHAIVAAAAVALVTLRRDGLARTAACVAGGLAAAAAGIITLKLTGAWQSFYDVFTYWNPAYADVIREEFDDRVLVQFHYFPPWSYLPVLAVPLALLTLLDARPWAASGDRVGPGPVGAALPAWLWDAGTGERVRLARLALAAAYLAWTLQGILFQRGFHYVHVPEILLLLALFSTYNYRPAVAVFAWQALATFAVAQGWHPGDRPEHGRVMGKQPYAWVVPHPLYEAGRWRRWGDCFKTGLSDEAYYLRRDDLAMIHNFFPANDWPELAEAAEWLRARGVKDGETVAWHDAPHAVYVLLDVQPGFRFQHVTAIMSIGLDQEATIWDELEAAAPHVRYVLSDLHRVNYHDPELLGDPTTTAADLLPTSLHPRARAVFPYDQPALFRTGGGRGRYVIHELKKPIRRPPPGSA